MTAARAPIKCKIRGSSVLPDKATLILPKFMPAHYCQLHDQIAGAWSSRQSVRSRCEGGGALFYDDHFAEETEA